MAGGRIAPQAKHNGPGKDTAENPCQGRSMLPARWRGREQSRPPSLPTSGQGMDKHDRLRVTLTHRIIFP
jgi:hypothetical protein